VRQPVLSLTGAEYTQNVHALGLHLRWQIPCAGFNQLLTAVDKFILLCGFTFVIRVTRAIASATRRLILVNNFVDNNL